MANKLPDMLKAGAIRVVGGVAKAFFGMEFEDVMAAGCKLIHRFEGSNAICLTFDDGPNPDITPSILSILARYQVRATFFIVGENARRHPELLRAIAQDGHEIGNHTMTHPSLYWVSPSVLRREVVECQDLIAEITGERPESFRAPYGHFRWDLARTGRLGGIRNLVCWDVSAPWQETDPEALSAYILDHVRPGSIAGLHDNLVGVSESLRRAAGAATAMSLNTVIPYLLERGIYCRTVSEQVQSQAERAVT
jgi:peptidoglycan/xylan/chitin deacetylase (PgdA/CDA1 family)